MKILLNDYDCNHNKLSVLDENFDFMNIRLLTKVPEKSNNFSNSVVISISKLLNIINIRYVLSNYTVLQYRRTI